MTHDDAQLLIAKARANPPTATLAQLADALEAVMLERIDILATCSRKIADALAAKEQADQEADKIRAERDDLMAQVAAIAPNPKEAKAAEIERWQKVFHEAGEKLQALRAEPMPSDAIKEIVP